MKNRFALIGALTALAVVGTLVLPAGAASGLSQSVSGFAQVPAITVDQDIAELCLDTECKPVKLQRSLTGSEIGIILGYSVNPSAALPSLDVSAPMPAICEIKDDPATTAVNEARKRAGVAIAVTGGNFAPNSSLALGATQDGQTVGQPLSVPAPSGSSPPKTAKLCLL